MELVSIIMPAHFAEKHIWSSVESVMKQSHTNWELFIIDDCSKDNTLSVIRNLASQDERIKVVSLEKNVGPAMARNAGLKKARGRYIAFLDSDDYWLPNKLQRSLEAMKNNSADFIYTSYRRVDSENNKLGRFIHVPKSMTYSKLLGNTAITTSTVVYDSSVIGKVYMQDVYYDDFACWLEILKRGGKAYGLNEDLTRYRLTGIDSVSGNKINSAKKVWWQLRHHEKLGLISAIRAFMSYSIRGYLKHRKL
ncbi:glycosyl transferase [Kangiella geojedonensis]|uniref:Glycosyl transferase n=2 Tax=Kangiella geojedonensis TaxID=914150 RepID=A0A0F6TRB4_9GAMM|nr:glycosyl transferase [Kangiella geojedonensis]